jgi:ADP-ribose pyrophosphatase YjhB (NUDIX family)
MNPYTTLVVAAILRQGEQVLLIQQQGGSESEPYWALPGGVVERDEYLDAALRRELREETGLQADRLGPLAYTAQIARAEVAGQTLAFVFTVEAWSGDLRPADPDQVIHRAAFLPLAEAIAHLRACPYPSMGEPAAAYLSAAAPPGSVWFYRVNAAEVEFNVGRVP